MKKGLLQNPAVVGILAVTAIVMVIAQFRKPKRGAGKAAAVAAQSAGKKSDAKSGGKTAGKGGAKGSDPKAAANTPTNAPAVVEQRIDPADNTRIDTGYLNQHFGKWVESPNRDPFGHYPKPSAKAVANTRTNASDVLRVSAIWRQTGQRLAVINGKVTAEKAEIDGYKVDHIDATVVRVVGPHGPDQIVLADFGASTAPVRRTNSAPRAVTSAGPPGKSPGS